MRRAFALIAVSAAMIWTLTACSSGSSTAARTTTSKNAPTTTTAPLGPPAGVPAAPVPESLALNADLTLPAFPDVARYHGQAKVSGSSAQEVVMDRAAPSQPFFSPTVLIGSAGQRLTLTLVNKTPTTHDFTLEAEHVDQEVVAGQSATVTVQFPRSGAVVFYCKLHSSELHAGELYVG